MKPVPGADLAAMNPPRRRCGKGERGEPSRYVLVALSALVPSHCAPGCAPSQAPAVLVRLAMLYVHDEAPYDVVRLLRLSAGLVAAMVGARIATVATLFRGFNTLIPIIRALVLTRRTLLCRRRARTRSGW